MKRDCSKGFTLLELLGSIAIIGILIGLMGSAAYAARQRAFKTTAYAEVQQITAAIKAYWTANRAWPPSLGGSGEVVLTEEKLADLIGAGADKTVYLEVPPDRLEDQGGGSKAFCDPWGNPYRLKFDEKGTISSEDTGGEYYDIVVSFPNQYAGYFEVAPEESDEAAEDAGSGGSGGSGIGG